MIRIAGAILAATAVVATASPLAAQTCPDPTSISGTAVGVEAHARYLADDALEGRASGSPGARCAADYLASRFQAMGLTPAGEDGSFFQVFEVRVGARPGPGNDLRISGNTYERGKTWQPYGFAASGRTEAELVYAGEGVSDPRGHGAPLTGVEGRIAVVEGPTVGAGGLYSDPHFKASTLAGRGAAGVLILLPEGAALPVMAGEVRPSVGVPVAAVAASEADRVREAARRGDAGRVEVDVAPDMADALNVLALLPGSEPALAGETVVVGAHYDHLGWGGEGSLAPDGREIHNGADDNASGTATLVEVAGSLAQGPRPGRSILFMAFSGEEKGLLGSGHYVNAPVRPLESTVAMINMDMVGRLRENTLTVYGLATAEEWEGLLAEENGALPQPFRLSLIPDGYGPSDQSSFYGKGIPVLHFFTNTHEDYHRPSDDWHKLNLEGMSRIGDLVADVALRLAGTPARGAAALTAVTSQPNPHAGMPSTDPQPTSSGYGAYFGSIPDMTPLDFGVRFTGVREDSPAEHAGVLSGDVLVSFGGKEIGDLYAFTYALQEHRPGDEVEIVVLREGERVTLTAVLGQRR
jgi:hypothetical protein